MIQRRGFLGGILAACAAPAIARSGVLMPVRNIVVPPLPVIVVPRGNRLISLQQITRECLEIIEYAINREFAFGIVHQDTDFQACQVVRVAKPTRYVK